MMNLYLSNEMVYEVLSLSNYGLISLAFAAMTIGATLSLVGLPAGIQRFVSFYKRKRR